MGMNWIKIILRCSFGYPSTKRDHVHKVNKFKTALRPA